MGTRLSALLLSLSSFAWFARAQLPEPILDSGFLPSYGDARDYVSLVRLQYRMIGLESEIHSVTTEMSFWQPQFSPDGSYVAGGQLKMVYDVQFFGGDGVTAPPPPIASQSPLLRAPTGKANPVIYVTDRSFNAIRAINSSGGSILATRQLPANGTPQGIAISPDGKFLWVCEDFLPAGANASEIEIIDTSSFQIVGSIPLGPKVVATYIALTPDGSTAYVTNTGLVSQGDGSGAVNSILILDAASRKVTGQFAPPLLNTQRPAFGSAVFDRLAVSPDGTLLYAVSALGIFVFDTLTNTQISPPPSSVLALSNILSFNVPGIIPTLGNPIVFHPGGKRAYFTSTLCPSPNGSNICVAVMDTTANQIVDAVPLGPSSTTRATGLGISADGALLAVKEFNSGDWIVIDTATDKIVVRVPGEPQTITVFFKGY